MHYYQFNIADYRKDTQHLSPIEHYIYRSLLDWHYLDEEPIPKDTTKILRFLRLDSDRLTDVEQVLNDFWTEREDGYIQERVLFEINEYRVKIETASRAGKASAAVRKAKRIKASKRESNDRSTTVQPTINHKPLTNNQEEDKTPCPAASSEAPGPVATILYPQGAIPEPKTPDQWADATIDALNHVSGKSFKHTEANRKFIRGRLSDGHTPEELLMVIGYKTLEWKNDPRNNKYLRPETLFNATKFESYLNDNGDSCENNQPEHWRSQDSRRLSPAEQTRRAREAARLRQAGSGSAT